MRWLVKQRRTMYSAVMVLYVVAINILFYSSGNFWVIMVASLGNFFAGLTIVGFAFHNRVRKIEREERRQQRAERRAKKQQEETTLDV